MFESKAQLRFERDSLRRQVEKQKLLIIRYQDEQLKCELCEHSRPVFEEKTYPYSIVYRCTIKEKEKCENFKPIEQHQQVTNMQKKQEQRLL